MQLYKSYTFFKPLTFIGSKGLKTFIAMPLINVL